MFMCFCQYVFAKNAKKGRLSGPNTNLKLWLLIAKVSVRLNNRVYPVKFRQLADLAGVSIWEATHRSM